MHAWMNGWMDGVTGETWNGGMEMGVERRKSRSRVADEIQEKMKVLRGKEEEEMEWRMWGQPCGTQDTRERQGRLGRLVFGGQGGVMADICTVHGHLWWFIYPRPLGQASDLPEFVRLEGAPYHTTQFLTFHISCHFQLPVSLHHWAGPSPVQENRTHVQSHSEHMVTRVCPGR